MRRALWLFPIIGLMSVCSAQQTVFSISGNSGVGSVVMHLTGKETKNISSNILGDYSFSALPPGNYVVTPKLAGHTFKPSSRSVTIGNANRVAVSFSASNVQETGLVTSPSSLTLSTAGATEQLKVEATYSDESAQDVTANATYASNNASVATVSQGGMVTAVGRGTATIIASYGGMASSVSVTVNIPNVTYSISGSAGVSSVTVSLTGPTAETTQTSSSGTYSFSNLPAGNYIITPSLTGETFNPASQSKTITNANISGVNFAASTVTSHLVDLTWGAGNIQSPASGQVVVGYNVYRASASGGPYTQLNSAPVPSLTYADSAVSAGQTWYYVCSTVDNLGNVSAHSNQSAATIP